MADASLSLVIATVARPTLVRTLKSLLSQDWRNGDEILVVGDGHRPEAEDLCGRLKGRIPVRYTHTYKQLGTWGHHARNWIMDSRQCRGSYLMALDDDDEMIRGAVASVRVALGESPAPRPHIFRMINHPAVGTVWKKPELVAGNLGTPTIVVPNDPDKLGRYGFIYIGDFMFAESTCAFYPDGPVFRPEEICDVRPYSRADQ